MSGETKFLNELTPFMFWIIATFLVMVTMLAVYWPSLRAPKADTTQTALKNALIAELNEINADKGARFANDSELAAARAEVGRRLLALGDNQFPAKPVSSSGMMPGLFALVPILAVPLYLQFGQPDYPDQNFATRPDQEAIAIQRDVNDLILRVEKRLAEVPQDAKGWALVAPIYYRSGRAEDALNAYEKAVQFHQGDTVSRSQLISDRAEILVAQANGKVSPEALKAFAEAIKSDPQNQKALFYNAIGLEQNGDQVTAKANWEKLIAEFEAINPPWLAVAKQRLTALGSGPSAADVQAAQDMTPEARQDMIKGMVDGLAARLVENPQDIDGWLQLIRSRQVLGDKAQLGKDLQTARGNFVEGSEGRAAIDALATELGI